MEHSLKEENDRVVLTEKNRITFMRNRGCDILKVANSDNK